MLKGAKMRTKAAICTEHSVSHLGTLFALRGVPGNHEPVCPQDCCIRVETPVSRHACMLPGMQGLFLC